MILTGFEDKFSTTRSESLPELAVWLHGFGGASGIVVGFHRVHFLGNARTHRLQPSGYNSSIVSPRAGGKGRMPGGDLDRTGGGARRMPQHPPFDRTVATLWKILTPVNAAGTVAIPVAAPLIVLPETVPALQLNSTPSGVCVMELFFTLAPDTDNTILTTLMFDMWFELRDPGARTSIP